VTDPISPIRDTDDAARATARNLLRGANIAAIAFADLETGAPGVARIGFGLAPDGMAISLVSDLALHTRALRQDPRAALMIGEPADRGDPLNSPRLSVTVMARFIDADSPDRASLRQAWLGHHPKARLYVDFADFHFVGFEILGAALNGGFGRAYRLAPADLA